jgi:hypothetical protein
MRIAQETLAHSTDMNSMAAISNVVEPVCVRAGASASQVLDAAQSFPASVGTFIRIVILAR